MRLALTSLAAAALLAAPLSGRALAHGGSYRPPPGEVPPDSREPSDPPPPPEGGGPTTGGGDEGGGPTTGGGDAGGPTTGGDGGGGPPTGGNGGGTPPTGGTGGGATTGPGKRSAKGPGYGDWTFWWNFNKEPILNLKSAVRGRKGPNSGAGSHGLGNAVGGGAAQLATDSVIHEKVIPALRDLLQRKDVDFDIQSAAGIALAKIGDGAIIERLIEMARNDRGGARFHKAVEESAALSLGLLQRDTPEIREFLIEIVRDAKGEHGGSFVRPFAAISLGLLGDSGEQVPSALLAVVNGKESGADVKPACLLALGLIGSDAQCDELLALLRSGRTKGGEALTDVELAHVVAALGAIGRPGLGTPGDESAVLDAILAVADPKSKADKNVRRSAAIALGQIAPDCDVRKQRTVILPALKRIAADAGGDAQERHFALIALGRVGSAPSCDKAVRAECIDALSHYLEHERGLTQPFAAMGLGLVGRTLGPGEGEERVCKPLRRAFDDTCDARSRGAFAIASGLVRDPRAVKDLIGVLEDDRMDSRLRGHCAVALGMIQSDEARAAIRVALTKEADRELRVQSAVAAGLMRDAVAVKDLVRILEKGDESQYVIGSVALALGQIGDERAIPPLLEILRDERRYPELTRALATVALGQIGDRRDAPTLSRIGRDVNYRAYVPAIAELLTIL